ncbi:MAG: formylglycine-generating enzyme family protein [Muribaculaceae bacterium]|nr:formylglycine-generating enzyme family protein [Muribaculaceae bacterium]
MKKTLLIKAIAAVLVLIGCVVAQRVNAEVLREVKVQATNGQVLNTYYASDVDCFEFVEREVSYPFAEFAADNKDNIVFHLAPGVKFKMIKVQGGTYALQSSGITWAEADKTKDLSDYYIAEFECTQAVWKAVKGSVPSGQTATGDDMPLANVSWNNIMGDGDDTFLKLLNTQLPQIKANSAADVVAAIGNMQFRLPNEWEWEYAANGGKDWVSLNYYFSGTSGTDASALNTVAVNSVSPNKATSVALVGSKLPNNLGLYDMSGNVWEWCSGLGYPGYETSPGYLKDDGSWNSSTRPLRGGDWDSRDANYFRVSARNSPTSSANPHFYGGFRLAL